MKIEFKNTVEEMKTGMKVIDAKGPVSSRRVFWYLGCFMVLYWYIPPVFQDPKSPLNLAMALLAVLLTVYVWKGSDLYNSYYAKKHVAGYPNASAEFTESTVELTDCGGTSSLPLDGTYKVFDYKDILAFSGEKNKIAIIPLTEQPMEIKSQIRTLLQEKLEDQYQMVSDLRMEWGKKKDTAGMK